MTNCADCAHTADCNGPADCEPVVPVAQKPLSEMTISELQRARLAAVDAGRRGRAFLIRRYIIAHYKTYVPYPESHE